MMMKVLCQKKSCQRFKDSYQDTWNFICASKKGETFFHCTVCAIDIACAHGGKSDVRRHVGTKNHIDLAKVKQNCCSMKTFINSPNITKQRDRPTESSNEIGNDNVPTDCKPEPAFINSRHLYRVFQTDVHGFENSKRYDLTH
jgi:hypothetical protein